MPPVSAYDLSFAARSAAVGRGEGGGTCLRVPGHLSVLCGAADRQRIYAVRVSVTVAVVPVLASVARRPDEDRPEAVASLQTNGGTVTEDKWGVIEDK